MKLIKSFKLSYFIILFLILYALIWILDPSKAKGIFWGSIGVIDQLLVLLNHPETTSPVSKSSNTQQQLQTFLTQPNSQLLELRDGFYNKPAGYYITVDDQNQCKPNFSQEFEGVWETPARILCPQVAALLNSEDVPYIDIESGCKDNRLDATRRGWSCENVP